MLLGCLDDARHEHGNNNDNDEDVDASFVSDEHVALWMNKIDNVLSWYLEYRSLLMQLMLMYLGRDKTEFAGRFQKMTMQFLLAREHIFFKCITVSYNSFLVIR